MFSIVLPDVFAMNLAFPYHTSQCLVFYIKKV